MDTNHPISVFPTEISCEPRTIKKTVHFAPLPEKHFAPYTTELRKRIKERLKRKAMNRNRSNNTNKQSDQGESSDSDLDDTLSEDEDNEQNAGDNEDHAVNWSNRTSPSHSPEKADPKEEEKIEVSDQSSLIQILEELKKDSRQREEERRQREEEHRREVLHLYGMFSVLTLGSVVLVYLLAKRQ